MPETRVGSKRQWDDRFLHLLDKAGAGIFLLNRSGRFVQANAALCRGLGYSPGELAGMAAVDLLHPGDMDPMRGAIGDLASGRKRRYRRRIRYIRKDGALFWGDVSLAVVEDAKGAIETIIGVVIDINDQKQVEEQLRASEARYRRVFEKSGAASVIIDPSVIVYGESGTGKELVARAIHDNSDRKELVFVVVNCGAIPETLLESEFFGYRKGAFTGADRNKHGYLDLAGGGTLFLDELGEIGVNMQVKLLRVLEGRAISGKWPDSSRKTGHKILLPPNFDFFRGMVIVIMLFYISSTKIPVLKVVVWIRKKQQKAGYRLSLS